MSEKARLFVDIDSPQIILRVVVNAPYQSTNKTTTLKF